LHAGPCALAISRLGAYARPSAAYPGRLLGVCACGPAWSGAGPSLSVVAGLSYSVVLAACMPTLSWARCREPRSRGSCRHPL